MRSQVLIIDDYLVNPDETRQMVLCQDFNVRGNYPVNRIVLLFS